MKRFPLISVIIAVYNGECYLNEAIESVITQNYSSELEILVVDDGSTDASSSIAKKHLPTVNYIYQSNQGLAAAQNSGIKAATGTYLAFLDADDLWLPNKLSLQTQAFENDGSLEAVFGYVEQFYSPDVKNQIEETICCPTTPAPGLCAQAMLIKRNSFERIGYFSSQWRKGPFIEWYTRAQDKGLRSNMLPETVVRRRLHTSNSGILHKNKKIEYVRILKAAMERRRKNI